MDSFTALVSLPLVNIDKEAEAWSSMNLTSHWFAAEGDDASAETCLSEVRQRQIERRLTGTPSMPGWGGGLKRQIKKELLS